jgi:hypothetical protein
MTADTDDTGRYERPSTARLIGYGFLFGVGFVILLGGAHSALEYYSGEADPYYPLVYLGIAVMEAWIGSSLLLAGVYGSIRLAVTRVQR